MSSRRPRIAEGEVGELVDKLQSLLPESRRRSVGRVGLSGGILSSDLVCRTSQASASKLLKETCSYIRGLHKEVDDLSDRLSALLSTMDGDSPQAEVVRSLLR